LHTLSSIAMSTSELSKRTLAEPSRRLEAVPAYMFAELERRVTEMRERGIDVISLGIGDPDRPTYPHVVEAMQEAVADPVNHRYPSNRGRAEFRRALSEFYERRFGVEIDPESEVIPAIGAKECIYNLCFAFLDPGDVALAADPGYPVYTGGPALAGADAVLMPLRPELGFVPDLDAIPDDALARARLLFVNYPNNPTGAVVPDGFFERLVELARAHQVLVVHDNAYSETTYDGYVAPSFLATPGAKEVGVEVFSLSKGFNMTGWRCAAILGNREAIASYWRLKTNVDSGLFEAVQLAGAAALAGPRGPIEEMNAIYAHRRDLVVDALREIGVRVDTPKGTIYVWAPVPDGHTSESFAELVLTEAAVVVSPGSMYGPNGEGFFRISLTTPDERIAEAVERMREHLA
jgi:LL-diaminopimelate aminotransferase